MSYTEFLNRKKASQPKVIDTQMRLPDASSFTWRTKLGASRIWRPTDHVITNSDDPSITPNFFIKKPSRSSGGVGRVPDASDYLLSKGVTSIGHDDFTRGKLRMQCVEVLPPPSQIVSEEGALVNVDTYTQLGLNMGYMDECCTPLLSKSYFVDTIPAIKTHKIGVTSREQWDGKTGMYGVQNTLNCVDTNTHGNWGPKDEKTLNLHSPPPQKLDFLTAILGPQISENGAYGRAPKVGAALRKIPYVEKHHGRAWGPRPYPSARVPPTGAPQQLKINSPFARAAF